MNRLTSNVAVAKNQRMKNERGVSMLETVIIVALVSILTVFAFMARLGARQHTAQ